MTRWEKIIVHHSASGWGNAKLIDGWHKTRGWSGIGYHFVILNGLVSIEDFRHNRRLGFLDGAIETGRPLDGDEWVEANEIGAHALGHNADSIGVCLIHNKGEVTAWQRLSLLWAVSELADLFDIPTDNILGHCELDAGKPLCPGIDMVEFRVRTKQFRQVKGGNP